MKRIISSLEKNPVVRSLALTALVIGALITIGKFFIDSYGYIHDKFFVASNISNQIRTLAAGQSIEYFRAQLGSPILQRMVTEKFTELVFEYRGAFVQALADTASNEVVYWAITYCGNGDVVLERPVFSMPGRYLGDDDAGNEIIEMSLAPVLRLNRTTFAEFFREQGDLEVFFSGATANSFARESRYFGNPSAYQTIFVGVNDICGLPEAIYEHVDVDTTRFGVAPSKEAVENFRKSIAVNTYAETAPFMGDEVLSLLDWIHSKNPKNPYLNFGVNRVMVRYFPEN